MNESQQSNINQIDGNDSINSTSSNRSECKSETEGNIEVGTIKAVVGNRPINRNIARIAKLP